jgi:Pyruvate/2-oxoacid:ferredoxin oxidoreductase delta subunit
MRSRGHSRCMPDRLVNQLCQATDEEALVDPLHALDQIIACVTVQVYCPRHSP